MFGKKGKEYFPLHAVNMFVYICMNKKRCVEGNISNIGMGELVGFFFVVLACCFRQNI